MNPTHASHPNWAASHSELQEIASETVFSETEKAKLFTFLSGKSILDCADLGLLEQ